MPTLPGAPPTELARSEATRVVAELAARSHLFMAHYEHRVLLDAPDAWRPAGRDDLGQVPSWQAGVLAESKYLGFRHDLMIGSFHPGHRAKWTGHELLHALVGFAWRPGAPIFFHALAARLAEVLPVALWYFLDEAGLRRCADHAGGGPLYGAFCPACEHAATLPPRQDPAAERWLLEGRAFVERELQSVAQARKLGRPTFSRHATLDLMSDGMAYAAAHAPRLGSPEFERFASRFFVRDGGLHGSLDALEERIRELLDALTGQGSAKPLRTRAGSWDWIAQDIGWRLSTLLAETEGEAADVLDKLIDDLAARPGPEAVEQTISAYDELYAEYRLPSPATVMAVGYPLPGGHGRCPAHIEAGLESVCPATLDAAGPDRQRLVRRFVQADIHQRVPLGRRFAAFVAADDVSDPRLAVLARFEAAIGHAGPRDAAQVTLGWDGADPQAPVTLASGAEVISADFDVLDWADNPQRAPQPSPRTLVIYREAGGQGVAIADVSASAAAALTTLDARGACMLDQLTLEPGELEALADAGIIVPVAWRLGEGSVDDPLTQADRPVVEDG